MQVGNEAELISGRWWDADTWKPWAVYISADADTKGKEKTEMKGLEKTPGILEVVKEKKESDGKIYLQKLNGVQIEWNKEPDRWKSRQNYRQTVRSKYVVERRGTEK